MGPTLKAGKKKLKVYLLCLTVKSPFNSHFYWILPVHSYSQSESVSEKEYMYIYIFFFLELFIWDSTVLNAGLEHKV